MLAKVIAHAGDRTAAAIELLAGALGETRVVGPTTNIAYLRALLARPEVRAGDLDTELLERLGADVVAARAGPRAGRPSRSSRCWPHPAPTTRGTRSTAGVSPAGRRRTRGS